MNQAEARLIAKGVAMEALVEEITGKPALLANGRSPARVIGTKGVSSVVKSRLAAEEVAKNGVHNLMNKAECLGSAPDNGPSSMKALRNSRANEAMALVGELSAALVHDLRNPIAAISAGAELLMSMNDVCPQSRRLALNIYSASVRVERLVQELVSIARGGLEESENCKLAELVDSAFECILDAARSQGVDVEIFIPSRIQLKLRRERMKRVFVNMMSNALESMLAGGRLRISGRVDGDDAIVEIDDTGEGIPYQLRQKLFQPFVTSGKSNGIGLGLALSRQTVLDHGGDLWLGEKPERGALFYLRLPLQKEAKPWVMSKRLRNFAGRGARPEKVWARTTANN
jgi:signal transduction histidine kinase